MEENERIEETVIDGYEVELRFYTEGGEPRSDCGISTRDGQYTASLTHLEGHGTLWHVRDSVEDHVVDPRTIRRIRQWADDNGY